MSAKLLCENCGRVEGQHLSDTTCNKCGGHIDLDIDEDYSDDNLHDEEDTDATDNTEK